MRDSSQDLQENNTTFFLKKKNYNSIFYWKSWVVMDINKGGDVFLLLFSFTFLNKKHFSFNFKAKQVASSPRLILIDQISCFRTIRVLTLS
jgi:hypothetical protein